MADKGASDLFVTVDAPINIKINGETHPVGHNVLDSMSCRQLIYSLLADDQIRTFEATYALNIVNNAHQTLERILNFPLTPRVNRCSPTFLSISRQSSLNVCCRQRTVAEFQR
jgi:Tfp pilus assembly ATPase PilU